MVAANTSMRFLKLSYKSRKQGKHIQLDGFSSSYASTAPVLVRLIFSSVPTICQLQELHVINYSDSHSNEDTH